MWKYILDGERIATIPHPDAPYVGMPVCWVGRHGIPAPVENFIVSRVQERTVTLERA